MFKLDGVPFFWCLHNKNLPERELCQLCKHGILHAVVPKISEPSDLCESKADTRRQPPGDVKKRFCGKVDVFQVKSFAHSHEVNQRKHQGSHKVSNKRQHIPCWKSSCYIHTLFLYLSFPFECPHQSRWSWVTRQTDAGFRTCIKNQRLLSRRFWNRSALVWNSKLLERKGRRENQKKPRQCGMNFIFQPKG